MNCCSNRVSILNHLLALLAIAGLSGCAAWRGDTGADIRPAPSISKTCDLLRHETSLRIALQDARARWKMPPAVGLALLEPPLRVGDKEQVLPYGNAWDEYRMATQNWSASSRDIHDALDFLGWTSDRNRRLLKLDWNQVEGLYLAYRLGPGAYTKGVYKGIWIEKEAQDVAKREVAYAGELKNCPALVQPDRWEWQRLWTL